MIFPEIKFRSRNTESARLSLYLQESLPYFRGHFARLPVLPGVVQIGWAVNFGHEIFGCSLHVKSLKKIKFNRVVHSDCTIDLSLDYDAVRAQLTFRYENADGPVSSGYLELVPA